MAAAVKTVAVTPVPDGLFSIEEDNVNVVGMLPVRNRLGELDEEAS